VNVWPDEDDLIEAVDDDDGGVGGDDDPCDRCGCPRRDHPPAERGEDAPRCKSCGRRCRFKEVGKR
jgi:hypothetical protein